MSKMIRNTAQRVPYRRMSIVAADEGALGTKIFHKVTLSLVGLVPVAFILSPSKLNMPIDLALGFAIPFHSHIGMNYVITDYASKLFGKGAKAPAQYAMVGVTGLTVLGLTKLNLTGPGITETVKSMWYKEPKKE